ncbi:MAG: hypothetical protein ACE5HQ_00675 [Gemmatimonadota bacterium]
MRSTARRRTDSDSWRGRGRGARRQGRPAVLPAGAWIGAAAWLVTSAFPAQAVGQGMGIAAHAGTLGVGADIAFAVGPKVALRGGSNYFPFTVDVRASDTKFRLDLPSGQSMAVLDVFLGGAFRLSGGVLISGQDVVLTGRLPNSVSIGNQVYDAADVGTLTGVVANDDVAPYFGIGLGNVARSRVGFLLDLGVALQGRPRVDLAASGPVASLPEFQANLEAERRAVEDDLRLFRFYPVLSVGFSIGAF